MTQSVYIIAEAGVNHNGDKKKAIELIDVAAESGADAVKFQTFQAERLVTTDATKAPYQFDAGGESETQYEMLKDLELEEAFYPELVDQCKRKNIDFLSTAFDEQSLKFLTSSFNLKYLKIPSGEITNGPLILAHARLKKRLIMSTGMASMQDIEEALGVIAFGLIQGQDVEIKPSRSQFREAYRSQEGQKYLKDNVTLLHCLTQYPAPLKDINLMAMLSMQKKFSLQVGYSDHSEGSIVPIAAASLGAVMLEKHFTLDKSLPGPDHKASLDPNELNEMVISVRKIKELMGDGKKDLRSSELENLIIARKSIRAFTKIKRGEILSEENMTIKRPGGGLSPMLFWKKIGIKASRDYRADEQIED